MKLSLSSNRYQHEGLVLCNTGNGDFAGVDLILLGFIQHLVGFKTFK